MNSKKLEKVENFVIGAIQLFEKVQRKMEQLEEIRNKQIEMETGINKEFLAIWLKGKILSVVPIKWRDTAFKVLY